MNNEKYEGWEQLIANLYVYLEDIKEEKRNAYYGNKSKKEQELHNDSKLSFER